MRKTAILKLISSLLGGAAAHTGANGHQFEGSFKGFACSTGARLKDQLPSTRGLLEGTTT